MSTIGVTRRGDIFLILIPHPSIPLQHSSSSIPFSHKKQKMPIPRQQNKHNIPTLRTAPKLNCGTIEFLGISIRRI